MFPADSFSLLLAPPAWGKTRLLHQWLAEQPRPFLYISPLRALADEVAVSLSQHPGLKNLRDTDRFNLWQEWARPAEHARIMIATVEQLGNFPWEELRRLAPDAVVVWDEIHLVSLWGFSFREKLLQQFWGFCSSGIAGVGLTATADEPFMQFLTDSLTGYAWTLLVGDAGNFTFKHSPARWLSGPALKTLLDYELQEARANTLVFCARRDEVDTYVTHWQRQGLQVIGCKGGETRDFPARLGELAGPLVIVATSCLSHGVNLPQLARVVVLYDEKNPALFHQMITRAGRRGEVFEVWCPWRWGPTSFNRAGAFARWLQRVMVAQLWAFVGEWWDGTGRNRHPNHSAKGA